MNNETIQLRNLSIGYAMSHGVRTVAEGINGAIRSGELTCLLGPNGVGKSTLLRTLSAFQPAIRGEVLFTVYSLSSCVPAVASGKAERTDDYTEGGTACQQTNCKPSTVNCQPKRDAVVSFNVGNIHHLDMGTLLDRLGIAVRTGHHCAQPLMDRLGISGTVRASFALYNTK